MATGEKNHDLEAWTRSLHPNAEFQLRKPPVWPRFSNSNHHIYTVTDGPQYCNHLRPMPEGSVRWYAQRASSMCMCMSPWARWKMVHHSYLYVLSFSVMQAGVTCTSFSNYTAWKWQLEKKNHDLAPELAAYTLTRSFSYTSHQCGRDSPTPITIYVRYVGAGDCHGSLIRWSGCGLWSRSYVQWSKEAARWQGETFVAPG